MTSNRLSVWEESDSTPIPAHYCACGCHTAIAPNRTWAHGHHTRVKNPNINRKPRIYVSQVVAIRFQQADYKALLAAANKCRQSLGQYIRGKVIK